jgi:predicted hydrocarbon binding protein
MTYRKENPINYRALRYIVSKADGDTMFLIGKEYAKNRNYKLMKVYMILDIARVLHIIEKSFESLKIASKDENHRKYHQIQSN